jgi:hypothetical protein
MVTEMDKTDDAAEHMSLTFPVDELAHALGRSSAFLRVSMAILKISECDEALTLEDAVNVIRYFAPKSADQDTLLTGLSQKLDAAERRELELAVALEITKQERSSLKDQVNFMQYQLEHAQTRGDRLEKQLHDVTASFAHILSQRDKLVARSKLKSRTSIKQYNGREVLYLEDPVNLHMLDTAEH